MVLCIVTGMTGGPAGHAYAGQTKDYFLRMIKPAAQDFEIARDLLQKQDKFSADNGEFDNPDQFQVARVVLGDDGMEEIVFTVWSTMCGTVGCSFVIARHEANGWRLIGEGGLKLEFGVVVLARTDHGYHRLRGAGREDTVWTGSEYRVLPRKAH